MLHPGVTACTGGELEQARCLVGRLACGNALHCPGPVLTAAALMALKKKKLYETQLEQVENNILRVNEQQVRSCSTTGEH